MINMRTCYSCRHLLHDQCGRDVQYDKEFTCHRCIEKHGLSKKCDVVQEIHKRIVKMWESGELAIGNVPSFY